MHTRMSAEAYRDSLAVPIGMQLQAPCFTPPTERFFDELSQPDFVTEGGIRHAAYTVNTAFLNDESAVPLVVNLSYYQQAGTRGGAAQLSALADRVAQPVTFIEQPGIGNTSCSVLLEDLITLDSLAHMHANVLRQMYPGRRIDLMGFSIGGALAARTAVHLGGQARSLLTFAAVGLSRGLIMRCKLPIHKDDDRRTSVYARQRIQQDAMRSRPFHRLPSKEKPTQQSERIFAAIGRSIGAAALHRLPKQLHPTTFWRDAVGTRDTLLSWRAHQRLVTARNRRVPGSASSLVIKDVGHEFFSMRMVLTAQDVAQVLASRTS